jgi:hypothetical protein
MNELRYTLVSDGSSDASLLPVLNWLLVENGVTRPLRPTWADLGRIKLPTNPSLADKLRISLEYYPCELLFVHRDAESQSREARVAEIENAVSAVTPSPPVVCVIPVRMVEAWLLIDANAIKSAAGNSRYAGNLTLPDVSRLERLPDPKEILHELLKQACDLNRRRLRRYPVHQYARRVSDFIRDFSALRRLDAFNALEEEILAAIESHQWNQMGQ